MVFRPHPSPSLGMPLGVRSAGIHEVDAGWYERHPGRPFWELFWCVSGCGQLVFGELSQELRPGWVGVYPPWMPHDLRASSGGWKVCWLTLDGPAAKPVLEGLGLGSGLFMSGFDEPAFGSLLETLACRDEVAERKAETLAYELLCRIEAAGQGRGSDPVLEKCLGLIHENWNDSGFGIAQLCRRLGIHRSTLSRKFSAARGMPVVEYLIRLRLQHAVQLLRQADLSIADIARRCGYPDQSYFTRSFRQRMGQPPSAYR